MLLDLVDNKVTGRGHGGTKGRKLGLIKLRNKEAMHQVEELHICGKECKGMESKCKVNYNMKSLSEI